MNKKPNHMLLILIFLTFPIFKSEIHCPPDHFRIADYYWDSEDHEDKEEPLYGFQFNYRASSSQYDDYWSGIVYEPKDFCYEAISNIASDEFDPPCEMSACTFSDFSTVSLTPISSKPITDFSYVVINKESNNLKKLFDSGCKTVNNKILMIMEEPIEFRKKYVYYFTVVNPSGQPISFKFQTHSFKLNFTKDEDDLVVKKDYLDKYFSLTNEQIIEPYSVVKVPVELTFNPTVRYIAGKTFMHGTIKSNITGESTEKFYHADLTNWKDRLSAEGEYSYPVYTNFEIELESNDTLYISTYSMMHRREKEEILTYIGNTNNQCNLGQKCIEGYGCKSNKCTKCKKYTCNSCTSDETKCTKCFPISKEGQWNVLDTGEELTCDLNFVDITKFTIGWGIKQQVPPAIHFRVTLEFWMFVASPKKIEKKFGNIIYKDFMAISLYPEIGKDLMNVYCVPLEFIFKYPDSGYLIEKVGKNLTYFLDKTLAAPYLNETIENSASKWFYVRCAYNVETSKYYLNDQVEYNLEFPQYFHVQGLEPENKIPFHIKKHYKETDMTYLQFDNFTELNDTYIYLRNLNIYREYMPQNIITKYYNMHEFKYHSIFPQLLFSMPLDDLPETKDQPKIFYFKTYNYWNRGEKGILKDNVFILTNNSMTLYHNITNLRPPRTFQRLNLFSLNYQTKDCDMKVKEEIQCSDIKNMRYCFDTDSPFVCKNNTDDQESPYYLDIFNLTCNTFCREGYMRALRDTDKTQSQYCSKPCGDYVQNCPFEHELYTQPLSFVCKNGFYDLYYKCYDEKNKMNLEENVGMYYSGFLNDHTILIPLKHEYKSYAISVWIYPEYRLRNYKYDTEHERKKSQKVLYWDEYSDYTLFMTNSFRIKLGNYNNTASSYTYSNFVYLKGGSTLAIADMLDRSNWNRLLISFDQTQNTTSSTSSSYEYYVTFTNYNYFGYYGVKTTDNPPILSAIVFCHQDKLNTYELLDVPNYCQTVKWYDAHYRKIQVIDLSASSRYAAFFVDKWEDGPNYMLRHQYITSLGSMNRNVLKDTINDSDGYLPIITRGDTVNNPDHSSFINYEAYYAADQIYPSMQNRYINSVNNFEGTKATITFSNKVENCTLPLNTSTTSRSRCMKCVNNMTTFNGNCYDYEKLFSKKSYFVYKNPGINMPEKLSLNIHPELLKVHPSITVFFFINIYGFTGEIHSVDPTTRKLVIFDEATNFYLGYDPKLSAQSLFIEHSGRKLFEFENYKKQEFGHWAPVSIAAYRETDRTFQLNMVQASIYTENLAFNWGGNDGGAITYEMPYLEFTEFSITSDWVGLIRDVYFFGDFIMNVWGSINNRNILNDDTTYVPLINISLRDFEGDCVNRSDLISPPEDFVPVCKYQYNPYDKRCGNPNSLYLSWYQGETTPYTCPTEHCAGTCGTAQYLFQECQSAECSSSGGPFDDQTCASINDNWINYYPVISSNSKLVCTQMKEFNFNRLGHVYVENIRSPDVVFNVDFWFYTQTFRNVFNTLISPYTQYSSNPNEWKKINFKNIVIEWDLHLRIIIEAKKVSDDFADNRYEYYVTCQPLIVRNDSRYDSEEKYTLPVTNRYQKWFYVNCGVNYNSKKFYLTVVGSKMNEEKSFNPKYVINFLNRVNLNIDENSPRGFGTVHVRELRLWNCYYCSITFKHMRYETDDFNFNDVLHCFRGYKFPQGQVKNYTYKDDVPGSGAGSVLISQYDEYPGFNILDVIGKYEECDETIFTYLNEETESCERQYNIARVGDFSFTLPSSRTHRYTMEFWFFIEQPGQMSNGLNLYWDKHMSITLITDKTSSDVLLGICFPQAYRDKVDGLKGNEVYDLYETAINKDRFYFTGTADTWAFVRCAVDHTRKLFYINENLELDIEGERLHGNVRGYRPFRYFDYYKNSTLKVQNAYINKSRIFLRQLRVFREYLDYRIFDTRYINWDNSNYYNSWISILFTDMRNDVYWSCDGSKECCCGLRYRLNDPEFPMSAQENMSWLYGNEDVYYTTFPSIYIQKFCAGGQTGGNNVSCSGSSCNFCYKDTSHYFYVPSGSSSHLLDMDKLELTNDCNGTCRLPDVDHATNNGYCLLKPGQNNVLKCGSTYATSSTADLYNSNFVCSPGYTKVYFECIKDELITNSAMFFSNFFSFNNLRYVTPGNADYEEDEYDGSYRGGTDPRLISYYIEIWFKLDKVNYHDAITEEEVYLYAFPHKIFRDPSDQLFKYTNLKIASGTSFYTLQLVNDYEWNKIIIENYYFTTNNTFNIRFFTNYQFQNPEVQILNLDASLYKMHFRGIVFCNMPYPDCLIKIDPVYLHWGNAWYRNIRIWDAEITSLQSIQACEIGYTQLINAQKYYWPFTINYIQRNTILDIIDTENHKFLHNFWFWARNYDDAIRENYSTENFDYSLLEANHFISGMTSDKTDYELTPCYITCKRCYTASSYDCYECVTGYVLIGRECRPNSGYYLKTPPNSDETEIKILTEVDKPLFNIKTENPLTITIWVKYFGIILEESKKNNEYYPLFFLYDKDGKQTFLGYKPEIQSFVLVIENEDVSKVEAYSIKIKNYVGNWAHFGFSVHHSTTEFDYFPHMFNFMIDRNVIRPTYFVPTEDPVYFNEFVISSIPIAYYSSLQFYTNFWYGTFGHVNAVSTTRGVDLLYNVNLYGTAPDNCITDGQLTGTTVASLSPVCVADYIAYDDINNFCSNDNYFIDLSLSISPPCSSCSSYCNSCYNKDSTECTCDYYTGLYWVKSNSAITDYQCEKIDSINFAYYESITFTNLNVVKNDEMAIHFWLMIYEYKEHKFESLDIIWKKHLHVKIADDITRDPAQVTVTCYPYDYTNFSPSPSPEKIEGSIPYAKWVYIRCMADKYHLLFRLNNQEDRFTKIDFTQDKRSTLTIVDNTLNFNYGFSFVRELRLYSSYNFDFWDDSFTIVTPDSFPYLLHYYSFALEVTDITKISSTDIVEGAFQDFVIKSNRIGYNYVIDYTTFTQCNEGYLYSLATEKCELAFSGNCIIDKNEGGKCLKCPMGTYLYNNATCGICDSQFYCENSVCKSNDICVSDCSPYFYADVDLGQCRSCDPTCFTCSGKLINQCLSCNGTYYLVKDLNICVLNCQVYNLTEQYDVPNTCGPFKAHGNITNPVFLTDFYDYNVENSDYKSKIIDLSTFTSLTIDLYNVTSSLYSHEWIYNYDETIKLNKNYRSFNAADIGRLGPFIGDLSQNTIQIDPSFFKYGYKYYIQVRVINQGGVAEADYYLNYTLIINDYPEINFMNVLPAIGYTSNLFLFTCNQCVDDKTSKQDLLYKFTYIEKSADVVDGFNDNPNEIVLQDWDSNTEVLHKFENINQDINENNKYYIKCYCKDQHDLYNSTVTPITVYDPPLISKQSISIADAISTLDLDEVLSPEQLSNRAEFIATVAVNYDNEPIINRTNITNYDENGETEFLNLYDPVSQERDSYCNKRADSYVIYYYLTCECQNYYGSNCQIDGNSYQLLVNVYRTLYQKVIEAQTTDYNEYLLNVVYLLVKSGSQFLQIADKDFLLNAMEFITLCTTGFGVQMVQGDKYKLFFEMYHYLLEYGMHMVDYLKSQTFFEYNSKLATGLYNEEYFRNATLSEEQIATMKDYFKKIKNGLEILVYFYTHQKFELRYKSRNLNVYIKKTNQNFNYINYFSEEIKNYEPYFDLSDCLKKSLGQSYNSIFTSIIYKISPYMSDEDYYWSSDTHLITVRIIDGDSLKKVYINDCGRGTEAKFYFPVTLYMMVDLINQKKNNLSPENQIPVTGDIFSDPVYIDKKGKVYNTSVEERRGQYFVPFNFSCKYYLVENEGEKITLLNLTLDYHQYTNNHYILCYADKLHQPDYSEYIVDVFTFLGNFHLSSRFFYLKHYRLLTYGPNYKGNYAFYFFVFLASFYIVMNVIYAFINIKALQNIQLLNNKKKVIIKQNLPYREDLVFNDDLKLTAELKDKLRKKRLPDPLDANMDINNIDINIQAGEISDYDKLYKNTTNEIGGTKNDYFNPKKDDKENLKYSKFFRRNESSEDDFGLDSEKEPQIPHKRIDKQLKLRSNFFKSNFGIEEEDSNKINENSSSDENNDNKLDKYSQSTFGMTRFQKPNPPKKVKDETRSGKKFGKMNSNFFDESGIKKNDVPHTNVYHDEFDSYKAKYKQPKVVTEKLKFFGRDNYFGEKIRRKGSDDSSNIGKGNFKDENAPINIRTTYNQTEVDLNSDLKGILPNLFCPLTYNKRLLEFYRLDLTMLNFFKINLKNRYILKVTFGSFSIIYNRYQRIGTIVAQYALYTFFLSIFFTADAKQEILNKKIPTEIGLFVLYCVLSEIGACILVHIPAFMFYVDIPKLRPIYKEILDDGGLTIEKDFDKVVNHRFFWNVLGVSIQVIYFIISFYFSFGFVATYYYQRKTFALAILITALSDILIFEVLWEFILAFLYVIKKKGRCLIYIAEFCNRMRFMKTLT